MRERKTIPAKWISLSSRYVRSGTGATLASRRVHCPSRRRHTGYSFRRRGYSPSPHRARRRKWKERESSCAQSGVSILGAILKNARVEDSFAFLTARGPRHRILCHRSRSLETRHKDKLIASTSFLCFLGLYFLLSRATCSFDISNSKYALKPERISSNVLDEGSPLARLATPSTRHWQNLCFADRSVSLNSIGL